MSTATPDIRRARASDKPELIHLLRDSFLTTWTPMLPDEATEVFLRDKEAEVFTERCWQDFHVAELDGQLVGMLFIVGEHIESLHLDPSEKRKGYGSLLMDFAETTIRKAGLDEATLDVLVDNRDAILFYKARGYRVVKEFTGRESGDTPVQMYLMARNIGLV